MVRTRGAARREAAQLLLGDSTSEAPKGECEPVKLAQRAHTEDIRPTEVKRPSVAQSSESRVSASDIKARRIALKLEAAKKAAELERRLVEQQLEADLALLEVKSGRSDCSRRSRPPSELSLPYEDKVESWLEHSRTRQECQPVAAASVDLPPPAKQPAVADQLAGAITNAIQVASAKIHQPELLTRLATSRDLPQYSGHPYEWLQFKQSFYESSKLCKFSDTENVWRLRKCLQGEAKEAVLSLLIGNTTPDDVMRILELRFGRPESVMACILQRLKKLPPLPQAYHTELVAFAIKVQNSVAAARAVNQQDYLRSPDLVDVVLAKIPNALITKWADYAFERQDGPTPRLELLAGFLMQEANKTAAAGVSHVVSQAEARRPEFKRGASHAVLAISTDKCGFCKRASHMITECPRFKRAMCRDRWRYARSNKLCFKCLVSSHAKDTCPAEACEVDGCGHLHHRLLHYKVRRDAEKTTEREAASQVTAAETVANMTVAQQKVLLKVVPIRVQGPAGEVLTHALLDDGATVTLISSSVADRVGLRGRSETVRVRSAWNTELACQSETVNFSVRNSQGDQFEIRARKISELDLPTQRFSSVNVNRYGHLETIADSLPRSDVKPEILIGQDNPHLIMPTDTLLGKKNEPFATNTPLGWCVHGAVAATSCNAVLALSQACVDHTRGGGEPRVVQEEAYTCLATSEQDNSCDAQLDDLVRRNFALDAIGVRLKQRENPDEVRAVAILDESARLVDGSWEVGLPWKSDTKLPDSYKHAQRRLLGVEKKMRQDPEYGARYKARVAHLFQSDFARKVDVTEVAPRVWYLPHFGVDNPNKGKLRLVFDAAAESGGHSLNDYLLQGPDLLQSLLSIMLRFRERPVAVLGDIQDMFLRVRIRDQDQHALRFLWRGDPTATCDTAAVGETEPIQVYAMKSLIFGANCSPFVAQYIKNKNAKRFEQEMPEAVRAIVTCHYMDDYLDSFEDKGAAIQMVHQVSEIHKSGGFRMRNWTSNSQELVDSLPQDTVNEKVCVGLGRDAACERALGLLWFPESDTLRFDLSFKRVPNELLTCERAPTKREALAVVMSVFDVYGFLAPLMVKAKILLQRTWKAGVSWDDVLPNDLYDAFRGWLAQLLSLKELAIPRWYFYSVTPALSPEAECTMELHVFTDASSSAYAAVAYWRKVDPNGNVEVAFSASRCRAAPVKATTIPRLELQGALIGCRLAQTLEEAHRLKVAKKYYWCDSMIVLHWIRNKCKPYKTYIGNRLGEIDSLSQVDEWRYVPTKLNIADIATKENNYNLCADSEWFRGPAFLRRCPDEWPHGAPLKEEVKFSEDELEQVNVICEVPRLPVPDPLRFSTWMRLLRSTANVLLFVEKMKQKSNNRIDCDLMRRAEVLILRYAQAESFSSEISRLKQGRQIERSSQLRKLTPELDDSGILRVGGRIDAAKQISEQTKHPVILDGRNHVGRLLAHHYHVLAAHGSNEAVVNELRQKYWLLGLRPTVRSVASKCRMCRIRKAHPTHPLMGSLPEARLDHHVRPFTNTGCDLFGPMSITVGRRHEKVYGVIFTCLTIRAIHIELVNSLSADSFIMALRHMAARRGWPSIVFSDNGTNLRGAETELNKSFAQVQSEVLNKGVEWRFIPPGCPHMGGAWERLIRSVKTSLGVVLKERAPRQEVLSTLMAEVENVINSRPLTHVSVEPHTDEALTPNHFLLGSSSNMPVPGTFDDDDLFLRKQWRTAQRLTDMFWRRWVTEALPVLIPRQKWTEDIKALKEGDVVVVADPSFPRGTWPRGVVTAVHPGQDGRVRVVDVRTRTGVMRRPVSRLAVLPVED